MTSVSIRTRVLVPMVVALGTLLGIFLLSAHRNNRAQMAAEFSRVLASVPKVLEAQLRDDADTMRAALMTMARDEQMKGALRAGDTSQLLARAGPLFEQLRAEHQITHLYFTDPHRVNLLRVHKPDKSGDTIDRHTTVTAWASGEPSQGIEFGPLGSLTLRVVVPWYDEQGMIGFVELGEEIDHVISQVSDACGVELCIIVDKEHLTEEGWRAREVVFGPRGDWNQLPDSVVIAQSLDTIPRSILAHFPERTREQETAHFRAETGLGRISDGSFIPFADARGTAIGHLVVLHDITEALASARATILLDIIVCSIIAVFLSASCYVFLGRLQESLNTSEEKLRVIFDNATDGILLADVERKRFHTANAAACEMLRCDPEEITELGVADIHPQESLPDVVKEFEKQARGEITLARDIPVRRSDGSVFYADVNSAPVRLGRRTYLMGIFRDVTERRRTEQIIRRQAHYDALTDLPNRVMFEDGLEAALSEARRHGHLVAVLFLDVDRLKLVHDELGHAQGDRVLREAAQRLKRALRPGDIIARLGGDEFAASLGGVTSPKDAVAVAWRILEALRLPFEIGGDTVHVTASVGISLYPNDDERPQGLLKKADAAMYEAKEEGRNRLQFYTAGLAKEAGQRLALENDLRHALKRGEFALHYQPQVAIETGRVIAVEALLRWRHPNRGMLAPADFIEVAGASGLIDSIGEWVLRRACAQAKVWERDGTCDPALRMAVNLSAREFRREDLADMVGACLGEAGLDPGRLELEVSEGPTTRNVERSIVTMRKLKEQGVLLALDDFGLGHSSLIDLGRLPVDALKIDLSFIRDVGRDGSNQTIVAAIIAMARGLGLRTIAEGVETKSQLAFLQSRKCYAAQGYLYGGPVSAEALPGLLATLCPGDRMRMVSTGIQN